VNPPDPAAPPAHPVPTARHAAGRRPAWRAPASPRGAPAAILRGRLMLVGLLRGRLASAVLARGRLMPVGLSRERLRCARPLRVTLALLLVVAAAAACTADAGSDDEASPFADCASLTVPPPSGAPPSAAAGAATPGPSALPDLRLPCFTGGRQISLTDLRGPAVINIWASWCGPCRTELPVMQHLADRAQGRLTVVGVDTGDSRDAGASFAADKAVSFPTLFDEDRKLLTALAGTALPITVFLDADGRKYVHVTPLDERTLAEQARRHTGVTVTL
jgi:cytochrome c biogenesis protein CcmG/thiol:disulfide interchange protein DsbE